MEFRIDYNTIMTTAEEMVSREGNQAYSEDGVSLYDGIRMVSRDEAMKKRLMSEVLVSVRTLCNRFVSHVGSYEDEGSSEQTSLQINLELSPRRGDGKIESLKTLFRSLTVNLFLNKYFASKNQTELAAKYDGTALSDVQAIAKLLYEKLPPVYPTIYE